MTQISDHFSSDSKAELLLLVETFLILEAFCFQGSGCSSVEKVESRVENLPRMKSCCCKIRKVTAEEARSQVTYGTGTKNSLWGCLKESDSCTMCVKF